MIDEAYRRPCNVEADFGVENLKLSFLYGLFGFDFAGEDTRRRFLELRSSFMDERMVVAELGAEFGNGFLSGKGG